MHVCIEDIIMDRDDAQIDEKLHKNLIVFLGISF